MADQIIVCAVCKKQFRMSQMFMVNVNRWLCSSCHQAYVIHLNDQKKMGL